MVHPDKEIWDKMKMNPERYEYVPIPTAVWRIIKPKWDDQVLVCHYVHKDEWGNTLDTDTQRTLLLHYVKYDGHTAWQGGGYCFTHFIKEEKLKDKILQVAQEIANGWPYYAVKHRKKNA